MQISITGSESLAAATVECVSRHFPVIRKPSADSDVCWLCYDTPLKATGEPNIDAVLTSMQEDLNALPQQWRGLVLISSQIPVGTTARFEKGFPDFFFAHQPENIRVASAVVDFENQPRVVVGRRQQKHDSLIKDLFGPFTKNLILTDPETAEMSKHALNAWLAMNIAFANEIGQVCARVGADMSTITQALRADARVSPKTPLLAGAPFGGGHLERDLCVLRGLADTHKLILPIVQSISYSNKTHAERLKS